MLRENIVLEYVNQTIFFGLNGILLNISIIKKSIGFA